MRIAFDLDDTLIPSVASFPVELSTPPLLRLYLRESLRHGTHQLLQQLHADGHELWLYTTSWRSPRYLKLWFRLLGIPLGGIVNGQTHETLLRAGHGPRCSKYPPAFGIHLLIDDSEGVVREGQQFGFAVVRVDPADSNWTVQVLAAVGDITTD